MKDVIKALKNEGFKFRNMKFKTYDEALDAQIFIMNNFPDVTCPIKNRKIYLSKIPSNYVESYEEMKEIPVKMDGFIGSFCQELHERKIEFKLKKRHGNFIFKFNSSNDIADALEIIVNKRNSGFKELDELWEKYRDIYTPVYKKKKVIIYHN